MLRTGIMRRSPNLRWGVPEMMSDFYCEQTIVLNFSPGDDHGDVIEYPLPAKAEHVGSRGEPEGGNRELARFGGAGPEPVAVRLEELVADAGTVGGSLHLHRKGAPRIRVGLHRER